PAAPLLDAVAANVRFHHWELGFRQSSFRHIARALQDDTFSVFQCLPRFRHALFPSGFRSQVNRTAQRYFLRTSPDSVRDSAARSAAHTFALLRSSLSNALLGTRLAAFTILAWSRRTFRVGGCTNGMFRYHLLFPLSRFARFSREERP